MWGVWFDKEIYLNQLKIVDNIIIDLCPLDDSFEEKYKEKFTCD